MPRLPYKYAPSGRNQWLNALDDTTISTANNLLRALWRGHGVHARRLLV
jgi:hypothetical protein